MNGSEICKALIGQIETGVLKPGGRLRENELAAQFGVSRTPIREGLKRLEAQGLLVHEPHRGMIIPKLDNDQINELYVVREVLEGTAARLAAQHASTAEIEILQEMVEEDRANIGNLSKVAANNRKFHRRLALASHNRYLIQQIEQLKVSLILLDGTTMREEDRRRAAIEEHADIVEAITARDFDRAEKTASHHIAVAHKVRLTLL